jgi:hypothetical protein
MQITAMRILQLIAHKLEGMRRSRQQARLEQGLSLLKRTDRVGNAHRNFFKETQYNF